LKDSRASVCKTELITGYTCCRVEALKDTSEARKLVSWRTGEGINMEMSDEMI
jgi:hypothetical protein